MLALGGALAVHSAINLSKASGFIIRAAGMKGRWAGYLGSFRTHSVTTRDIAIPTRWGLIRARVYVPEGGSSRASLLTPGVHALGMEEPRLVKLAHDLSAGGMTVITPELPDLLEYRITPRLTDLIEDAVMWSIAQPGIARDGKIGIMGISFAGGLSMVAAGRPAIRDHVAFVLSFGGHGDFKRVLRYLCTGLQADGVIRPPHDYGVVLILLNIVDRLVPVEQIDPLREAIRRFLWASHVDMMDKPKAQQIFEHAREMEKSLPEPARGLMHAVNTRDVAALGPRLSPRLVGFGDEPALSPERSPAPLCPVYLLHGAGDNVIPAIESSSLARHLDDGAKVHLLITPLITHAEMDRRKSALDVWRLVRFWERLFSE